ncbi:MAG: hypothetical protein ACRYFS_15470 [Janthinobacterium lividum]
MHRQNYRRPALPPPQAIKPPIPILMTLHSLVQSRKEDSMNPRALIPNATATTLSTAKNKALNKNKIQNLIGLFALVSLGLSLCGGASAQSLDLKKPAPLQAGDNAGTVDNFTGNNFFYFYAGPGPINVKAAFRSSGILGAAMRSTLTVFVDGVSNGHRTWAQHMVLSSLQNAVQRPLTIMVKKPTEIIIAIVPPAGGLIRSGGDYTVSATGASVRFDKPLSDAALVVGTYSPRIIHDNEDGAVKFLPDGTLLFASGTTGTWKLFDADTHLFTVTFANTRLSLKLIPGRGLVDAADTTTVVFQRTR